MTPELQRWQLMLAEHRASLHEIIRLAHDHARDHGLDACRAWAERTLRRLLSEERSPRFGPFGSTATWGRNGMGRAIDERLRSAREFAVRALGVREMAA